MTLAALIIAITGLVLASLSLGWQVAAWTLTAGRVRLILKHGVSTGAAAITKPIGRDGALANPAELDVDRGSGGTEVLVVHVRNVGRMTVTVERYGAELLQPRNGSLIGMLLPQSGMVSLTPMGDVIGPPLPHPMEPGTSATWLVKMYDVRAMVHAAEQTISPRARSVRMFVELGNGKTVRTRHSANVRAAT